MEFYENKNFGSVPRMWEPTAHNDSNTKRLMKIIEDKYNVHFDNYWSFQQWSVDNTIEFWSEIWDHAGIICSKKYHTVVDLNVPMQYMPKWFEGAELNLVENLLKYRDDQTALIITGEESKTEEMTYAQLYAEVTLYASAFRNMGLKKGDIVACYMSNRKEAILAMMASVSIGAIWTGALPLLGAQAVLSRLSQLNPKVLVTVDRFPHNREEVDLMKNIRQIVQGLPSLEKVIIVLSKETSKLKNIRDIANSCFLDEFLLSGLESDGSVPQMEFEQVSASYPVFINFTSGTTGLPKPLMHGSGVLVSVFKDYALNCDTTRDSVWLVNSPVGWMTWNVYMCLMSLGCKLVLFEGLPYYLTPTFFYDLVDEFKITHIFPPASVLDEFKKRNFVPIDHHKLTSLKFFMSGGSIVKPSIYDFMYKVLKRGIYFSSGYGCTEMMGSSFLTEYSLPVHCGEISCISLGYSIECLDDQEKHVEGERGELVMTKPIPNLFLGIWGDDDGSKCREKYFSKYPGKFLIGDFAIFNPVTKGIVICGRSDDCLKQRGCRFGSSEIYNVVEAFAEVRDSLCVSHYNKSMDERAVLFLKMMDGHTFEPHLVQRIRQAIASELTPRHVPDVILEIKDIPYNINGKKLEILVKNIINKRPFNTESVSNPESLLHYKDRPELQEF